jgi:hypothetical protein
MSACPFMAETHHVTFATRRHLLRINFGWGHTTVDLNML